MKLSAEETELRRLGQDIHLFLRLAASNFLHDKDLQVIAKLHELADEYACGKPIANWSIEPLGWKDQPKLL